MYSIENALKHASLPVFVKNLLLSYVYNFSYEAPQPVHYKVPLRDSPRDYERP